MCIRDSPRPHRTPADRRRGGGVRWRRNAAGLAKAGGAPALFAGVWCTLGRHWLDVAGYAESDGGSGNDTRRPNAWHYRDYVFESFNQNKPIDQFLREQLAGDELISGKPDTNDPRHVELLTATGFMRMAPDSTQSSNCLLYTSPSPRDGLLSRMPSSA